MKIMLHVILTCVVFFAVNVLGYGMVYINNWGA